MKDFLISICSGIVGVLLTIGYQHFFAQPQPVTLIYSGEETVDAELSKVLEENESLKSELKELQFQYQNLQVLYNAMKAEASDTQSVTAESENNDGMGENSQPVPVLGDQKTSIFKLDTFQGIGGWYDRSASTVNDSFFIDTYDNEYLSACVGSHNITSKDSTTVPVYLLDGNYSKCEGQLAWPKRSKNREGSIWIEFYSGDSLIYQTEAISATDRAINFEFSVEGVEFLTVVRNGTVKGLKAIYPHLNLIR